MDPAAAPGPALATGARALWFALLLLAVGAAAFRLRVLPHARAMGAAEPALEAAGACARALLRAAGAGLALVFALRVAAGAGAGTWGPWLLEGTGTLLLLGGALAAGGVGGRAWRLAGAGAGLLCLVPGLGGHAMETGGLWPLALAGDALHVLASGVWLGSLAVLLVALGPVARATPEGRAENARLARAFSPMALAGAATVLATGVLRSLFHVTSAAVLWRTVYGNTLTFKVGVATIVLLAGLYNWRRALPRLGTRRGEEALRRTATLELAVAALVLLLTAVLVALPLP